MQFAVILNARRPIQSVRRERRGLSLCPLITMIRASESWTTKTSGRRGEVEVDLPVLSIVMHAPLDESPVSVPPAQGVRTVDRQVVDRSNWRTMPQENNDHCLSHSGGHSLHFRKDRVSH
jgi:hypothetical protein